MSRLEACIEFRCMLFLFMAVLKMEQIMTSSFAGKNIAVGVTGSIAAYKVADWVSRMTQEEANVSVIMTESATKFIAPLTFSSISGNAAMHDLFAEEQPGIISHIQLATEADCFIVAPATAQTISRLAHGMADDLLTAAVLATKAPVVVCPAMNSNMYSHSATQSNIETLRSFGYCIVEPEHGRMACRAEGPGRLADWNIAQESILKSMTKQDFKGQEILITAGPTREAIDAARFLSNRSSGKMGYALAKAAYRRGGDVVLVSGPTNLPCPHGVQYVPVITAAEMYEKVFEYHEKASVIIKSAAVADFRAKKQIAGKVKKGQADLFLELERNKDILAELGERRTSGGPFLVGFCAETEDLEKEARRKLMEKNIDLICANDISGNQSGFETDTNRVLMIDRKKEIQLPLVSKQQTADLILDRIAEHVL